MSTGNDQVTRLLATDLWIPFVGAGISVDSGLPLAGVFTATICERLIEAISDKDWRLARFAASLADVRMEVLLQEAHEVSQEKSPLGSRCNVFKDWLDADPNPLHYFIAERLRGSFAPRAVFTTNIDSMIEVAFGRLASPNVPDNPKALEAARCHRLQVVSSLADFDAFSFDEWRQTMSPTLFKLHGSVVGLESDSTLDTIQMSVEQLGRIGALAGKARVLESFVKDYAMAFFGYSGRDDFDLFPLLISQRDRHQWVWLEHVPADGGTARPIGNRGPVDQVEELLMPEDLGSSTSVQPRVHVRLYANTSAALRVTTEARYPVRVPASNVPWVRAIEAWLTELQAAEKRDLFLRLWMYLGGSNEEYRELLAWIESVEMLASADQHLIHRLRILKRLGCTDDMICVIQQLPYRDADYFPAVSLLAFALRDKGRYLEAFRWFKAAEQAAEQLPPTHPARLRVLREIIWGYRDLAKVLPQVQKLDDPAHGLTGALEPFWTVLQKELGVSRTDNFLQAALERATQAVDAAKTMANASHSNEIAYHLGKSLIDGAWIYKDLNDPRRGLEWLDEAQAIAERLGDVWLQARLFRDRAWFHWDLGRLTDALESSQRARWLFRGLPDRLERGATFRDVGYLLCYGGQPDEGERSFADAIDLLRRAAAPARQAPELAQTYYARGEARLMALRRYDDAVDDLLTALDIAVTNDIGGLRDQVSSRLREARKRIRYSIAEGRQKQVDEALLK